MEKTGGGGDITIFLQGSYRDNVVNHGLKFNLRVLFITAVFIYILKAHFSFSCLIFRGRVFHIWDPQ